MKSIKCQAAASKMMYKVKAFTSMDKIDQQQKRYLKGGLLYGWRGAVWKRRLSFTDSDVRGCNHAVGDKGWRGRCRASQQLSLDATRSAPAPR